MYIHRKWTLLSLSVVILLMVAAFSVPARGAVASGRPGGFLHFLNDTLTDSTTGEQYSVSLVAREDDTTAGVGKATLLVSGPGLSICSAHGPSADIDFSPGGEDFGGNNPLPEIQCGTAYGSAVSIDGCTAKVELHGYSHSDYPLRIYMGTSSTELTFRKASSGNQMSLRLFTPAGLIKLDGIVSGTLQMDTCP